MGTRIWTTGKVCVAHLLMHRQQQALCWIARTNRLLTIRVFTVEGFDV